jgi:hypothetical protein
MKQMKNQDTRSIKNETLDHAIKQLFMLHDQSTVGYDSLLIVGEEQIEIACHRVILQARCPVFKDIISQSSSYANANADGTHMLKIYLPEDDAEAISAIVEYCYTGSISMLQISTPQLASNLLLAAKKFLDNPTLSIFCEKVLAALEHQSLPASLLEKDLEVPNSDLDLTSLVDDNTFSDLTLRTGSEDIQAHKCIVLSQVPSLSSKLQPCAEMKKDFIDISRRSHESVKRVMAFLYAKVTQTNQEEVLEDLLTAKELHVSELVTKLERMVDISDDSALDILKLAVHNDLAWLKKAALDSVANKDFDEMFETIKCLEDSCTTIVVRTAEQARTRKAPQLVQGISLRGCLGLVTASVASVLFRMSIENEFFVAFTNICFCCTLVFFFL